MAQQGSVKRVEQTEPRDRTATAVGGMERGMHVPARGQGHLAMPNPGRMVACAAVDHTVGLCVLRNALA
ncbi:hypothetical protein DYS74_02840 [Sinirhodobacter hankyongi]|uniref:Uncharacterized protein n=1 Tax=Paenirhodobacter hankyongi TaxID=2294033 RepID=A0A421BVL7_9RHOB|nr:hypothetical protein DYS74_02840 [Sinirhodobacter hankyongi]